LIEKAILGGGCFWCLEAVYQNVKGVSRVVSGYTGGARPHPTYEQICSGATGHAEVVEVTFDSEIISFDELLEIFWTIHDPTTLNRQGADTGTQYRSVIFYLNEEQKEEAYASIEHFSPFFSSPIVTEVTELETFFPAEEYHQNYFINNPHQGYCQAVVAPKVVMFKTKLSQFIK
jgi:peptide-methionine (S)-S-oxide reductase